MREPHRILGNNDSHIVRSILLYVSPIIFCIFAALQAKEKIGALSRRIESKPPTTYLVPPKPTTPPVVFSTPYSLPSYVKVGNVCEIDPVLGI
jgi:hypothetical protein